MSGFAPRFTITNAITAGLTAIERARGFPGGGDAAERMGAAHEPAGAAAEAHYTTHIEGTQLAFEQPGPTDPNRHYVVGNSLPRKL